MFDLSEYYAFTLQDEEKKMIEMTEKAELSKVKHEFNKNINRTTFTPAPRPETGDAESPFGTALAGSDAPAAFAFFACALPAR